MSNTELARQKGFEQSFDDGDVFDQDGKLWLAIQLANRGFGLPLVNVGEPGQTRAIGYLNPNPDVNQELAEASADAMAQVLRRDPRKILFRLTSTKSDWFIEKASAMAGIARVVALPGGKDVGKVFAASEPGTVTTYFPVTKLPTYIGLPYGYRQLGAELRQLGADFVELADDVWTSGASLEKAEEYIHDILPGASIRRTVLAREAETGKNYPPRMDRPNRRAIIALPEFVDMYDPGMLFRIEDKDTGGIPPAIVL